MGFNRWVVALGIFLGMVFFGLHTVVTVSNQVLLPAEPFAIIRVGAPGEIVLFNHPVSLPPVDQWGEMGQNTMAHIRKWGGEYYVRMMDFMRRLFVLNRQGEKGP
ncbi:hypothetical protein GFC01_05245 [Desulfofundulus thermobenzoicus]|uniref:Uncharacterized protein n=1 Tax=Desulfofundulus thermobenzoicus TaxID=29376 RepID=A0A6N7INS2_9FIRM|nr:hypothetical protein [Desulfofundulus thermobenzoicus]MQL51675.1 hypothetical protein [Desulfofundulus thermobenzoicus]